MKAEKLSVNRVCIGIGAFLLLLSLSMSLPHVFSDKEYACSMLWTTLCCWCFRLYDAFSGLYKAETYLVFRCLM